MSRLLINEYLNELDRLRKFSGTLTEGVISEAFKDLLKAWSRQNGLIFLDQYEFESTQQDPHPSRRHDPARPARAARLLGSQGHQRRPRRRDRQEAAQGLSAGQHHLRELRQRGADPEPRRRCMRCSMTGRRCAADGCSTCSSATSGRRSREFRKAVEQFKADLPACARRAARADRRRPTTSNAAFRAAATNFLEHAKDTINPTLTEADVREMLIQHILTEEIFAHVFNEGDFHHENNIAKELYALEGEVLHRRGEARDAEGAGALLRGDPRQRRRRSPATTRSRPSSRSSTRTSTRSTIPKAADRLGVVYTPNEIVRFMIEGADWLCQKHFGKALIDARRGNPRPGRRAPAPSSASCSSISAASRRSSPTNTRTSCTPTRWRSCPITSPT